ncbi:1-acyl-sn-glycerol-3-phosphate acyltransferase [bioreactor metagenome]|uniref:1-acyl-sn-glycerol-3-phosphate acyltransferase n=1 Tax=bioreactor metagenome TaxID=1076179 RepID=A0A645DEA3_9ZZZZ
MFYKLILNIFKLMVRILFGFEVVHAHKSPIPEGKLIVCSMHTSNLDPIFLAVAFPHQLHFMAKVELFQIPVFGYLLKKLGAFPVNRGSNDIGAVKTAFKILKENKAFAIFPEGTRYKEGEEKKGFKDGISMIAYKSDSQILPVYITKYPKLFQKVKAVIGDPVFIPRGNNNSFEAALYSETSRIIMEKIEELSEYAK